jgi:hypothetical protein
MVIATGALLIANRLLPAELPARGDWQERMFWLAWLLAALHAAWRTAPVRQARLAPAWAEQCIGIAVVAVLAVLLNWITTGDHLLRTIGQGYWPVASIDLVLLVSAGLALVAARKLQRRTRATVEQGSRRAVAGAGVAHV